MSHNRIQRVSLKEVRLFKEIQIFFPQVKRNQKSRTRSGL